ncbi:hypothetical protein GCM10010172_47260 [Paractinoplanes ferrugineus]|uniref:Uncharacterized protein n=1 Tax=Paractinoplanes ferrugineus TaxID=113564 RepID=A0A919IXK9_9ACTN|nr:hypothetical protein [Actinoplanes ferrugineus]GIE10310.1 hypothetical protein Afe05nite_21500 [Actinoplanes ferrugineus]
MLAGDRVDGLESRFSSPREARPDRLIAETGVGSELSHHGISSRTAGHRADRSSSRPPG